ncbi:MAG TPA: DUF504 domain-containing protein [Euryarchaeota archaeon]|nr:MAG: hypothetical protein B6U90_02565 [Thermoplasmatales archaeon ex4484_6]RLF68183.1 MAG: DUF504 domain-containing protein [Thermoplasmata archaeon]HHD15546.1 DUF504 domain-containing protein [Euryarchaeota archaeon]
MKRYPRDVLLALKWGEDQGIEDVSIAFVSRGSSGGISRIPGHRIEHIGKSFMELKDGTFIPFHRIILIEDHDGVLWERGRP